MDRIAATVRLSKLPGYIVIGTIILCILPLILNLFGISFASTGNGLNLLEFSTLTSTEVTDRLFEFFSGSFIHSYIEWGSFTVAVLLMVLALVHYNLTRDVTVPLASIVIFWAGLIDAVHILIADRLISVSAETDSIIMVSWTLGRIYTAVFLTAAMLLLMVRQWILRERENLLGGTAFTSVFGFLFGIAALVVIGFLLFSSMLPETYFGSFMIKRPFDAAAGAVFVFAGLVVIPAWYRQNPGVFTNSLIVATLPFTAAQIYHAVGTQELYDNHFNVAHFLKATGYVVIFLGAAIDLIRVYRRQKMASEQLQQDVRIRKQVEEQLRENQRAMASSLKMAGNVQKAMLPKPTELEQLFHSTGWKIAFYNAPCEHLGGDIFGMKFKEPDSVLLYVADISGHGIPAALAAIGLTTHVNNLLDATSEPIPVFESVNEFCCRQLPEEIYATMVYCRINVRSGMVECINGGHQSVFLLDPNNQVYEYPSSAPALGLFQDAGESAEYMRLQMRGNSRMIMFSDGVTEMRNRQQEFFGVERLVSEFAYSARFGPEGTISRLHDRLDDWRGLDVPLDDDVTIVTLQWKQSE